MTKWNVEEYTVANYWAPAIINGDESGLEESECRDLSEWMESVRNGRCGHWDGFGEDDSEGFTRCEISGLRGDCSRVRYVWRD